MSLFIFLFHILSSSQFYKYLSLFSRFRSLAGRSQSSRGPPRRSLAGVPWAALLSSLGILHILKKFCSSPREKGGAAQSAPLFSWEIMHNLKKHSIFHFPSFSFIYFVHFLSFSCILFHVLSFSFMFFHVLSCSFMFFHVLSCSFMFFHVLSVSFCDQPEMPCGSCSCDHCFNQRRIPWLSLSWDVSPAKFLRDEIQLMSNHKSASTHRGHWKL